MKLSTVFVSSLIVCSASAFVLPPGPGSASQVVLRADTAETADAYFLETDKANIENETEPAQEPEPVTEPVKFDPFSTPEDLPGVAGPFGFCDALDFASRADAATMRRYREAELTHGRVGMLATLGFLAGEYVEGSSFLWNAQVSGPAITHLQQVPTAFWILLTIGIGAAESQRLNIGWVDPKFVPADKAGLLRDNYTPGDIGFDPAGIKPKDPEELKIMQTKELQNGRLGMLAAAGFMAQELVNGKGILENLGIEAHL